MTNLVNLLLTSYLAFYATDVLGMSSGLIGAVLLFTKLFDGFTDLVAGFIIDNTHTRFGKARPYDWTIPFIAVFLVLLFSTPHASQGAQAAYVAIMYVLLQAIFITLLGASDSVYLLRAFRDEKQRNSVYSISLVVSTVLNLAVGVVVPTLVAKAGTSHSAWTRMVLIFSVPFAVLGMIRFFLIKEENGGEAEAKQITDEKHEKKKDKVRFSDAVKAIFSNRYLLIFTLAIFIIVISSGFLNTSMAYYFKYFVGDQRLMSVANISAVGSLIMILLFTPLANKFGKDKIMKIGLLINCLGGIVRWIGGTNIVTIVIGMTCLYVGIVPIAMYFPLFLFDIMDYSEWKTGVRTEGILATFPIFANKVAGGLSVSLGSFILGASGYKGTLSVQPDSAMNAINACFNAVPTILCLIMTVIIILFYNMDKILPTVKKELEERKNIETKTSEIKREDGFSAMSEIREDEISEIREIHDEIKQK